MIVLDTHAWIWWLAEPKLLGPKARKAITSASSDGSLRISCMSTWELALLIKTGRLVLGATADEWALRTLGLGMVEFVPVNNSIALKSNELSGLHRDPVDRIIVATALELGATLVTKDRNIRKWRGVVTLW